MDSKIHYIKLNTDDRMPMIGIGMCGVTGKKNVKAVISSALEIGYRSIDTSPLYKNEKDIGSALKDCLTKFKLKREDIFITSKLSPADFGDKALNALKLSIDYLKCGYLDLYLINWPSPLGNQPQNPDNSIARSRTWEMLVSAKQTGLTKNIGVSNYTIQHMTELLNSSFGVKPSVNQVEWHPHYHQDDLKKLCDKHGIVLEGYSPLGAGASDLLKDPVIHAIAEKEKKEPSQIILRWSIQQGVPVIPKAQSKLHLELNFALDFALSKPDMEKLTTIQTRKYSWDASNIN